jgi:hypothetical protein
VATCFLFFNFINLSLVEHSPVHVNVGSFISLVYFDCVSVIVSSVVLGSEFFLVCLSCR